MLLLLINMKIRLNALNQEANLMYFGEANGIFIIESKIHLNFL